MVSAALPNALTELGVDIHVMLPAYPEVLDRAVPSGEAIPLGELPGAAKARLIPARNSDDSDLQLWLLDCPELYDRAGTPYQDPAGRDWPDNDLRFASLCHTAARVAQGCLGMSWKPEVVHANDWHAGLVPVLLGAGPVLRPRTVLTIHNLAFQGLFDAERLPRLGLPKESFSPDGLEFYGRISFLKAGIRYADRLTTVSRTYAQEIQTPEFGCGLEGLLNARAEDLVGIPNGADYSIWDPAHDPMLPRRYSLSDLGGKRVCKQVLQRELGLASTPDAPLVAFMSRVTEQKMADTVAEAVPWLVEAGAQFALHGQGDRVLESRFLALAERNPGSISVRVGYDEPAAHRLLAGADILLHPSRFEPFGLVPVYAMRYGTIPVVRGVGGLADSVIDSKSGIDEETTGFAFSGASLDDMLSCLARAIATFRQPVAWRRVQRRAMRQDFGWRRPAQEYLQLYRTLAGTGAEEGPGKSDRRRAPRLAMNWARRAEAPRPRA